MKKILNCFIKNIFKYLGVGKVALKLAFYRSFLNYQVDVMRT